MRFLKLSFINSKLFSQSLGSFRNTELFSPWEDKAYRIRVGGIITGRDGSWADVVEIQHNSQRRQCSLPQKTRIIVKRQIAFCNF